MFSFHLTFNNGTGSWRRCWNILSWIVRILSSIWNLLLNYCVIYFGGPISGTIRSLCFSFFIIIWRNIRSSMFFQMTDRWMMWSVHLFLRMLKTFQITVILSRSPTFIRFSGFLVNSDSGSTTNTEIYIVICFNDLLGKKKSYFYPVLNVLSFES